MSLELKLSPRQAQALRKLMRASLPGGLTPDELDAAAHTLARLDRVMAKHRVPLTKELPPDGGPTL